MIAQIEGKVIYVGERFAVVATGGVGYKIFALLDALAALARQKGGTVILWTHLAVRENALDLYGFLEKEELDFFELLLGISGVGPKTALGVLNGAKIKNLRQAIASGETAHLTKISGIGRKVADKIILELRDKITLFDGEADSGAMRDESDAIEGLKALGFAEREAREALKKLPKDVASPSERIKQALKLLGK